MVDGGLVAGWLRGLVIRPSEIGMALRQIVEMEGGVEGEVVGVVM